MNLNCLADIDRNSLDLFEAVGLTDVASLATAEPAALHQELSKANQTLGIVEQDVSPEAVQQWVAAAQSLVSEESAEPQTATAEPAPASTAVNYELVPEVLSMLESAPTALPLPVRLMAENKLSVSDIPEGIVLNCYYGDLDVRVSNSAPKPSRPSVAPTIQRSGRLPAIAESDRLNLLRTPRPETNKGRNPDSRRFIRGVLHSEPVGVYLGAIFTLLVMMVVPLAVASATLLMLSSEMSESFEWVPTWLLAFPIAFPVVGIAYLLWGLAGKCRVCNQKLFVHRAHLKNSKAHRLPGFGYVLPLCMQIIFFRWFRCTHCGTSIRLKE